MVAKQRGPAPLPTAVKERQGTVEASRVSPSEPQWPQFDAKAPDSLDDATAVALWDELAPELIAQGLAPKGAKGELVALCNSWATYVRAGKELAKPGGWVTKAQSGYEMPSVWVAVRKNALSEYAALCPRFGLDPASAGKVTARPPKTGEDELAKAREARRASR